MIKDVLTPKDVAKLTGFSQSTIKKWMDRGLLKGWRIPGSNHRRFDRETVLAFLRSNGIPEPAP